MCSIIGQWAQWPMCVWKCAVSRLSYSLHIYMHQCTFTCTLEVHISVSWFTPHLHEHIGQSDRCTFTCTHHVHVNVQWPVCIRCQCKCAGSQTIGSLHIFMHTSVMGLTAQLHEHIGRSDQCTFTCNTSGACKCAVTRGSDVCMYMCIESCAWLTPQFMHISVTRLTPHLHEHIGQSDHCTFACTHQVHVNVKWPVCLTCACKCAESQTIVSLHIFMHTLVIVPTAQLDEHIRQSVHCTFTSTHQVHENVQWPEWLTCAYKCAESKIIGSLHIFMHTSFISLTAQLTNTSDSLITAHLHARINCM